MTLKSLLFSFFPLSFSRGYYIVVVPLKKQRTGKYLKPWDSPDEMNLEEVGTTKWSKKSVKKSLLNINIQFLLWNLNIHLIAMESTLTQVLQKKRWWEELDSNSADTKGWGWGNLGTGLVD